jgi:hypothetical protein
LLSFHGFSRVCLALADLRVDLVHGVERQTQELVLVVPSHILLFEVLGLLRRRWRVGNLGDKICGRCVIIRKRLRIRKARRSGRGTRASSAEECSGHARSMDRAEQRVSDTPIRIDIGQVLPTPASMYDLKSNSAGT